MRKSILLVSGGLDSYMAWILLNRPPTLFVDYGQSYLHKEMAAIARLYDHDDEHQFVKLDGVPFLDPLQHHVDARNLQLATIAMRFADQIIFAGMGDELCSDKNPGAFKNMSRMLTRYSEKRRITLTSPFWDCSKAEVVGVYLKQGHDPQKLTETVSCYDPREMEQCLRCPSCFRRWCALAAHGIETPRLPAEYLAEYPGKAWKRLPEPRQLDTLNVLLKHYTEAEIEAAGIPL